MFKALLIALTLGSIAALRPPDVNDHQWPQFRGPQALGVADVRGPLSWSTTENVVWKTPIPGSGWSSPIVWKDRIFLTSAISAADEEAPKKGLYFGGERKTSSAEHRWMVYAIDWKTGHIAWEREASRGVPNSSHHVKNTYASETPVTDGERIYAYFGNVGIFCYDFSGKLLWKQSWGSFKTRFGWGTAASPVVYKDRVIVVVDNDEQSFIVALDKMTGRQLWRVERDEGTNWATPFIWESGSRVEIVTSGTRKTRSYNLDGKLLWELGGMSSIAIPTPFSSLGLLYLASGYVGDQKRPVFAVRAGASGDITLKEGEQSNQFVAWSLPQGGPYNPSPLVYGNYYYTLLDRGFFTCHDARTGKEVYGKQRIDPAAGAFTASPWAYQDKIFCLSEDGDTYVIQAGSEYKLVGKNSLDEMCMATPAIAQENLVLRTASKLYRIGSAKN